MTVRQERMLLTVGAYALIALGIALGAAVGEIDPRCPTFTEELRR